MITVRYLCVALACATLSVGAASAAEPTSADLDVHQVKPLDTLAIVKVISGGKVTIVDEDTIRVSGTPENLEIASVVVELLDQPTDGEQVTTRELPDGSHIARAVLSHASLEQVASELRAKVRIRQYGLEDGTKAVLVRDTKEQVQAALELIAAMEQEASSRP